MIRWEGEDRGRSTSRSLSRSLSPEAPLSCSLSLSWGGLSPTVGDLLLYWLVCRCRLSRAFESVAVLVTVGLTRDLSLPSSVPAILLPYGEKG